MNEEAFKAYLEQRFEDQCAYYDRQAGFNRSRYHAAQAVAIVCCALAPLIAAIPASDPPSAFPKLLMAALATIAGVCAALEKLMKFQENWLNYRSMRELLRRERSLFEAAVDEYSALPTVEERRKLFVTRVESYLAREASLWVASYRSGQQEKPPVQNP